MFLKIMPFTWNICRGLLPIGQPHQDALPIGRVGLFGLLDQCPEDHPLHLGLAVQGVSPLGPDLGLGEVDHVEGPLLGDVLSVLVGATLVGYLLGGQELAGGGFEEGLFEGVGE